MNICELANFTNAQMLTVSGSESVRPDDVLILLNSASALEAEVETLCKSARKISADWIKENGPLQSGNLRWSMAKSKSYKCRSNSDAINKLLAAAANQRPDEDAWSIVEQCLSANAIKPGAARTLLGDTFGEVFDTIESEELKLTKTNMDFVKSKKGSEQ